VLFGIWTAIVVVTYARVPVEELYNVSGGGIAGGLGRALVFVGYPTSFVAIATLPLAVERLRTRWAAALALVALPLLATVAVPGVLDPDDLDPKPVNALAASGVGLALVLTLSPAPGRSRPWGAGDRIRLAAVAAIVLVSLPWIAADLGFYLGGPFMGTEITPEPGHPQLRAVHLGHHHGMGGALLAIASIVLSRAVPQVRGRLGVALAIYLALLLVYGLASVVEDVWLEQLVKRGSTDFALPSMLRPELSPAWGALVVAAAVAYRLLYRPRGEPAAPPSVPA
jgi:hypothetical protein